MFSSPPTSRAAHRETADTWYLVQERDRDPHGPEGRSHILNVCTRLELEAMLLMNRKTLRRGSVKSLTEHRTSQRRITVPKKSNDGQRQVFFSSERQVRTGRSRLQGREIQIRSDSNGFEIRVR